MFVSEEEQRNFSLGEFKMDQRDIVNNLLSLMDNSYKILSVDWNTGAITIKHEMLGNKTSALTPFEVEACQRSKIEGIKMVRHLRGIGLAEAKNIVEKNFRF